MRTECYEVVGDDLVRVLLPAKDKEGARGGMKGKALLSRRKSNKLAKQSRKKNRRVK